MQKITAADQNYWSAAVILNLLILGLNFGFFTLPFGIVRVYLGILIGLVALTRNISVKRRNRRVYIGYYP